METLILYVIYVVYFDEATVNKKLASRQRALNPL